MKKEIEWRSETLLFQLKNKHEAGQENADLNETVGLEKNSLNYLQLINPLLQSSISVLNSFLNLQLTKKEIKIERVTKGIYDASTYFDCTSENFRFKFFLCVESKVLKDMYQLAFFEEKEKIDDDLIDFFGEVGNMISAMQRTISKGRTVIKSRHRPLSSVIATSFHRCLSTHRFASLSTVISVIFQSI